jgi:hypothetical protein
LKKVTKWGTATAGLIYEYKLTKLQLRASRYGWIKMQNACEVKHFHAYTKENYVQVSHAIVPYA